jgi:arabinofuranan 3-O-arabinosyltransferase
VAMPGTIEADGCGAPERPLAGTGGDTGRDTGGGRPARRLPPAVTDRWRRLAATPSFPRLTVVTAVCFWAASALTWTLQSLRVRHRFGSGLGRDLVTVWRAEVVFAHGGQPYNQAATDHRLYLYPPSSLLVLRPVAMLSLHEVQVLGLVATAALAWAMVMVTAAALGRRWWGLTSAVVVFALGWAQPMVAELSLENVTVICALALAAFYLLASRRHFIAAAVVIGLSLSVKPLLLPVVIVFLLARKGRALGVAILIPAVLNAIAFALVKNPNQVWSKLPSLLDRSGVGVELNSAWVGVAHGLPGFATILIRVATVALAAAGAWWSWQRIAEMATRLITTTSVLLIGTFLAGTLSENHFMLTLVPLAMTVIVPGAPMRRFACGIGVLWVMGVTPPGSLLGLNSEANLSAFAAFGMALILVTIVVVLGRRRSTATPAGGSPPSDLPERSVRGSALDGTLAR